MANSGEFHSIDTTKEPKPSSATPQPEAVTDGLPGIEDKNDPMSSQLLRHWDSPHHLRARPSNYCDSPIPFPSHLALSPNPTRPASSKELSKDIWRQAMFNKNHSLSETYLNTPSTPNNSVEVGIAFMSHPPAGPGVENAKPTGSGLDSTPSTGPSLDTTPVMDNTSSRSSQPPRLNYSPHFDYNVNPDLSRLEDPDSPYNYPPNMTFVNKRKFNNSYGSDQSSFSQRPVKQVKKKGKMEQEFFENGRNEQMDRTLNGSLDISGRSDHNVADRTWMPESNEKKKCLDKTWMPGATPSDSDEDNDAEMESTDLRGNSMDKTWLPELSTNSDSEDDSAGTSRAVQCHYCTTSFDDKRQMFTHMCDIHESTLMDAVAQTIPPVCTNCDDKNEPVAFCGGCEDDPFLCNPCVLAHKRVCVTKDHVIIFCSESSSSQNEEDPCVMLENILDLVYPERACLSKQNDLPDPPDDPKLFCPLRCTSSDKAEADIEDQVEMIRHESRKLAEALIRTNGSESSSQSTLSSSSAPSGLRSSTSRSNSLNSSEAIKVLTDEILADNLLPIFNIDAVDVKTKVVVVIEMLLQMDAVHPSLFCDNRSINGFKSLLAAQEVKFLHKALSSLDQLVSSVGKKDILFGLKKMKEELSGELDTIREPNTKLRSAGSSAFNQTTIKKMASDILAKIDDFIG